MNVSAGGTGFIETKPATFSGCACAYMNTILPPIDWPTSRYGGGGSAGAGDGAGGGRGGRSRGGGFGGGGAFPAPAPAHSPTTGCAGKPCLLAPRRAPP